MAFYPKNFKLLLKIEAENSLYFYKKAVTHFTKPIYKIICMNKPILKRKAISKYWPALALVLFTAGGTNTS